MFRGDIVFVCENQYGRKKKNSPNSVTKSAYVGNETTAVMSRALQLSGGFRGVIPRTLTLGLVVIDANVTAQIDAPFDAIQLNSGAVHAFSSSTLRLQSVTISRNATLSVASNTSLTLVRNGLLNNDGLLRVVDSLVLNGALNQTRYGAMLVRVASAAAPLLVEKLVALDGTIRVAGVGSVYRAQYTLVHWRSPLIIPSLKLVISVLICSLIAQLSVSLL